MRRFQAFILIVSCVLLASLAAPAQKRKNGAAKMPTIVVEPIDTEALKTLLTQPRQRPLLVNFWATFCDPCRDEFPDLVKIDKDYRPQSLEFVTVSLDDVSDIKTTVPEVLGSMKATMPAYLYQEKVEVVFKNIGRVGAAKLRDESEKLGNKGE